MENPARPTPPTANLWATKKSASRSGLMAGPKTPWGKPTLGYRTRGKKQSEMKNKEDLQNTEK